MLRSASFVVLTVIVPLAGRAAPHVLDPEKLDESSKLLVTRADAAVTTLQKKLAARLLDVMREGGPSAAVTVCRERAAGLTVETAKESGVDVGRTSDRLRNPNNAAPPWAAAFVSAAAGRKAAEVHPVIIDLGDAIAVLRPIPVGQACTRCHGSPADIPPPVARTLAEAYPRDRAIGYAQGDHRGFIWAVVQK